MHQVFELWTVLCQRRHSQGRPSLAWILRCIDNWKNVLIFVHVRWCALKCRNVLTHARANTIYYTNQQFFCHPGITNFFEWSPLLKNISILTNIIDWMWLLYFIVQMNRELYLTPTAKPVICHVPSRGEVLLVKIFQVVKSAKSVRHSLPIRSTVKSKVAPCVHSTP